jgi:succinoglycan biosynthesis protein ExoV
MRLYYYEGEGEARNFGDELNPFLWDRLLPDLDRRGAPDWLFVGIGTLLNERLPAASRTIVFGSGVGYGKAVPRPDHRWKVYFVRGPRSAAALGLPSSASLTDPAILVARVWREPRTPTVPYAFVPHWEGANEWLEGVCRDAGIDYIDPRWPVEKVLRSISKAEVVLAEAMHGAIVADALRVPWIPVRSSPGLLAFKWQDWCDSVGLPYSPHVLPSPWEPILGRPLGGARAWAKEAVYSCRLRWIARTAKPLLSSERTWKRLLSSVERRVEDLKAETPLLENGEIGDAS